MKLCPYCAEEIQDAAIKCKHCGEFLQQPAPTHAEQQLPWHLRKSFIIIAFACVGPLALPLLWLRPRTPLAWKIGLSVAALVLSWFLYRSTMQSIEMIKEYYQLLDGL